MDKNNIGDAPAYIGRCNCGCGGIMMATVDLLGHEKEVAKEVADCIREGFPVERVTVSFVKDFLRHHAFGCLKRINV